MKNKGKERKFILEYEITDVPPLAHYFEEILPQTKLIPAMGLLGETDYLFYYKNGLGSAYFELESQRNTASSTSDYFLSAANTRGYKRSLKKLSHKIQTEYNRARECDVARISTIELKKREHNARNLDAQFFAMYQLTEPYRLKCLEDHIADHLRKKVAASRIEYYLSELLRPGKLSIISQERVDRLKIIRKYHGKPIRNDLNGRHGGKLYADIVSHYKKYHTLMLGDGNWEVSVHDYTESFLRDRNDYIQKKAVDDEILQIIEKVEHDRARTDALAKELGIDSSRRRVINEIRELTDLRLQMHANSMVQAICCVIVYSNHLAKRLGFNSGFELGFLSPEEYMHYHANESLPVSVDEVKHRASQDYLMLLEHGKMKIYYGAEASAIFTSLVADHPFANDNAENLVRLEGSCAQAGLVDGGATVFRWGDDMDMALASLAENPILITGQTRPSMMPLIRAARAIVTDEGGVTSHAAIIARELKIPTIINTKHATRVFKTGDYLFIDATNGMVSKDEKTIL